ncbi:MAG TPA: hypothetical protein VKC54_01440 [Patescibacteria group bacterium]|nr:hypothetical protein [Patescibacteria group bacterium]
MIPDIDFLQDAAQGVIFLHGISGGGKGEVSKEIKNLCDHHKIKFFYAASGDFFREVIKTKEEDLTLQMREIKRMMLAGDYIPTLVGISPPMENIFKDYFSAALNGEKAVLVMDGFLRIGEFEYQNKAIPSQVDQVAEAAKRGLKQALLSDYSLQLKFAEKNPELFIEIMGRQNFEYVEVSKDRLAGSFTKTMIVDANHVVIQIPPEDGNNLMKFRFQKALQKISAELNMTIMDGNQIPENQVNNTFGLLKKAILIQSGRFSTQDGGLLIDENLRDRSFDILTSEETELAGKELSKSISEINENLGFAAKKPDSFPELVKSLLTDNGLSFGLGDLREDDQRPESRKKRLAEFADKAKSQIVENELGVRYNGYVILDESLRPNVKRVENGPSLGVTYPQLVDNAHKIAEKLVGPLVDVTRKGVER